MSKKDPGEIKKKDAVAKAADEYARFMVATANLLDARMNQGFLHGLWRPWLFDMKIIIVLQEYHPELDAEEALADLATYRKTWEFWLIDPDDFHVQLDSALIDIGYTLSHGGDEEDDDDDEDDDSDEFDEDDPQ